MTLVEFLNARIAEDERLLETEDRVYGGMGEVWTIEAHDRAQADYEAKRRIIAIALGPWDGETIDRAVRLNQHGTTVVNEDGEEEEVAEWTTTRLLRALAAVYGDHADYQPEWKP